MVSYRILNLMVTVLYLNRIRFYNLISYNYLARKYSHQVKLNGFRFNAMS